jgi:hypothetical protein
MGLPVRLFSDVRAISRLKALKDAVMSSTCMIVMMMHTSRNRSAAIN